MIRKVFVAFACRILKYSPKLSFLVAMYSITNVWVLSKSIIRLTAVPFAENKITRRKLSIKQSDYSQWNAY